MIEVELFGITQPYLIVPAKTGVVYGNQTHGILCLQQSLEGLRVDQSMLGKSCEAWLHVAIRDVELSDYRGLDGKSGVLTWSNSD